MSKMGQGTGPMYARFAKRPLDLVLAIAVLILLAPVFALLALLVRLKLGPPILFQQERLGLRGVTFTLHKFRSMTAARDNEGNLLPDGDRLTSFGRFLRSTSLDELPELSNVLKGNMSLVGPRPLLPHYRELYATEQMRRHEVKPGLSGWAEVNGGMR